MAKPKPCKTPGCSNLANGTLCRPCYVASAKADSDKKAARCVVCKNKLARGSKGNRCRIHRDYGAEFRRLQERTLKVLGEEACSAPTIPPVPRTHGSAVIVSDLHIPFHDPHAVIHACKLATRLGIDHLIVAGDLLHADSISKYDRAGATVPITNELVGAGRALGALEEVFERITVIPGNHDQRLEKMFSRMRDTKDGRQGLELAARLLGVMNPDDAEAMTEGLLSHYLGSDKVVIHPLPQMELNGTWLIQHPGSVSRMAPQNERKMAAKHRKSVLQGHSHLWGIGFDDSATDICFNIGHMSRPEHWRYIRERPTHFPAQVKGYAVVLADESNPAGALLPVALHPRWLDPLKLLEAIA